MNIALTTGAYFASLQFMSWLDSPEYQWEPIDEFFTSLLANDTVKAKYIRE
jgi:hypothetical protein